MSTESKAALIKWFRNRHPRLYMAAMQEPGNGMGALSDTIAKVFDTVSNTVVKFGSAYVQGKAALDLAKANIKRAKAGLYPVDSLEEAQGYPQGQGMMGGIPQWALIAGFGVVALLILRRR